MAVQAHSQILVITAAVLRDSTVTQTECRGPRRLNHCKLPEGCLDLVFVDSESRIHRQIEKCPKSNPVLISLDGLIVGTWQVFHSVSEVDE